MANEKNKVVLIVEDSEDQREGYLLMLGRKCMAAEAASIAEAKAVYPAIAGNVAAIIMDGQLPESTVPLVKWLRRQGYNGPILANSADDKQQKALMAAGCSHSCPKPHVNLLTAALTELGLVQ